ncbi:RING-H2 finger protein ATL21A [Pyrus ussuriensis x Pyrus communis]|uniref:RING-type E3 ubiquitin transferase n=1 Tax=Pyrus ussuriensis x Pyrus communis TaxID=2448454 RepID=A0A5N5HZD8_9ROSA|nr:RING-H2 finger protein ATL21A [Pyrus ussuriensis x Pyrus communis]
MATLEIFTILFCLFLLPHTATTCGIPKCTAGSQPIRFPTILTLPLSGKFIVESINYRHQIISINDPNNCFPRRFLDHDISLRDSPFFYPHGLENYTFLNCSSQDVAAWTYAPISCLGSEIYKIVALQWDKPDYLSCEAVGLYCGLKSGSQTKCFGSSNSCIHSKFNTVNSRPPPIIATGLDGLIIESYPKTQLGENLELPGPKDKTCSICLGEYKPKATLRTIPACNHYFYASCVDEWLRLNATCPLCRNAPDDIKLSAS